MIEWYIDSDINNKNYIVRVKANVTDPINYLIDKIELMKFSTKDSFLIEFDKTINDLPILKFDYSEKGKYPYPEKDEFFIIYNSYTNIRFSESLTSILREIKLNNILNE